MSNAEQEQFAVRCKIRNEKYDNWKAQRHMSLHSNRPELSVEETSLKNVTLSQFKELVKNLRKEKSKDILLQIQKALCIGEEYVTEFLAINGALYNLTGVLTGHDADLQLHAAGCLMNLTTGSHKPTFTVLKATAPYLITFLHGSNPALQEQSAWTLGNMAADCDICRKQLKLQGSLPAVVPLLKSTNDDVLMAALFSLTCYTRYEQNSTRELLDLGAGRTILELVKKHTAVNLEILAEALFALFHFSVSIEQPEVERYFTEERAVEAIIDLLSKHSSDGNIQVLTALLRCLGNLATTSVVAARITASVAFMPCVKALTRNRYVHIRKELFWLLTNLICSNERLDLMAVVDDIPEMLKAKEEVVLEILYFLSTLLTFQPELASKISATPIPETLASLQNSLHENISIIATTTFSILQKCLTP